MKRKTNRILLLIIITILFTLGTYKAVAATNPTISANNCTEGENITVTITVPQDVIGVEGVLKITYSSGETKSIGRFAHLNTDLSWPGNYTKTIPATVAGNATIVVDSVIIIDKETKTGTSIGNLTTTVNIAAKPAEPEPTPEPTIGTGVSAGNSGSTTTQQPETPTVVSKPKVLEFTDVNETVYTVRRINLRQNYGTSGGLIKTLSEGEALTRTGKSTSADEDGYYWSRVSYNGTTGYVITSGLTTTKPTPKPVEETPENEVENNTVNNTVENNTVNEVDSNVLAQIQEEIGVIPEVGNNIMPNIFLGTMTFVIVLMVIIKKNKYLDDEE